MRFLITLSFLAVTLVGNSRITKWSNPSYVIVSDDETREVYKDLVKIVGTVYDGNGIPMTDGTVFSMDETKTGLCDVNGTYELYISYLDTGIFLFAPNYDEVLVSGYDFQGGHTVRIDFYPKKESALFRDTIIEVISYKPVIYLYSETPLTASLKLNYKGDLTFTYPEYKDGWVVDLDKTGILVKGKNKVIPYLFWEGKIKELNYLRNNNVMSGALIGADSLISFLEDELTVLGLNRTEQTDFITFWAPKMIRSNYVFVQFLVDEAYESEIAELNVAPKPQSSRRIYMLYTPFKDKPMLDCVPQQFEPFKREGFTVIEWGGSQIKIDYNEG